MCEYVSCVVCVCVPSSASLEGGGGGGAFILWYWLESTMMGNY